MHNKSNMRNKQMIINTCKILPFFKVSRTYACKMTLFIDFANSRLPLKKYPFFRGNGYERGIYFGREWGQFYGRRPRTVNERLPKVLCMLKI